MKRDEQFFSEHALELIYIAKRLKDALALEKLLTGKDVEYLVETDTYVGGLIFRTSRVGAFFYVSKGEVGRAHASMREGGYKPYEPIGD